MGCYIKSFQKLGRVGDGRDVYEAFVTLKISCPRKLHLDFDNSLVEVNFNTVVNF